MQIAYDVAIVGAGPTGLTLANILGQAGVRTVLIERNPGTVQEPRAVSIDDESLRTIQSIGLIDNVLKDVAQDYGSLYFTAGGRSCRRHANTDFHAVALSGNRTSRRRFAKA